jgi:hypothetical protein
MASRKALGRVLRMKRQKRRAVERRQVAQWQTRVTQARQKWLGKKVRFDLNRGVGIQYGTVASISDMGDVVVTALPGYDERFPVVMMSLGYLDQKLTLVE